MKVKLNRCGFELMKFVRCARIRWWVPVLTVVLFPFLIGILWVTVWNPTGPGFSDNARVTSCRTVLDNYRSYVEAYQQTYGRFPSSLREAWRANSPRKYSFADFKRVRVDQVKEYDELNGLGGYFYDPNTGEVRVNLTEPVRTYLPRYTGKLADAIPSEW